jgi:hypothetical protein
MSECHSLPHCEETRERASELRTEVEMLETDLREALDYLRRMVEEAEHSMKSGAPFDRPNLVMGARALLKRHGLDG